MQQYEIIVTGNNPLIMHKDNLVFTEKIKAWCKEPENKIHSVPGDDRTPPWRWIGYTYHDTKHLGVSSDNLMTMMREGGAKVLVGKGKLTFKKQTQSGILIPSQQWDLYVGGKLVPIAPISDLIGEMDFLKHIQIAEEYGFELSVLRARVSSSKHIRVRPMFRDWVLKGSLMVTDEELSGITEGVLNLILKQAGSLVGLCDWRPSSSKSGGRFGTFSSEVTKL